MAIVNAICGSTSRCTNYEAIRGYQKSQDKYLTILIFYNIPPYLYKTRVTKMRSEQLCNKSILEEHSAMNIILPKFRARLISNLSTTDQSKIDYNKLNTTQLTFLHYQKIKLETLGESSHPTIVSATNLPHESKNSWIRAIDLLKKPANLKQNTVLFKKKLNSAFLIINNHMPNIYDLIKTNINYICVIDNAEFNGASHPHLFGAIFLKEQDPLQLATSIVHEFAHQELFLINLVDRLVTSDSDSNQEFSPLQKKTRPPIGRLHSAHALFRMIQFIGQINLEQAKNLKQLLASTIATLNSNILTQFSKEQLIDQYEVLINHHLSDGHSNVN